MKTLYSFMPRCASVSFLLWLAGFPTAFGALTITSLSPSNGGVGICYDTPLVITFDAPPKVGSSGAVRIYSASDDSTPVDVIDLSLGNLQSRTFPGDAQAFNVYSVLIRGNTATIYPHAGVLTSNESYYVTVDPGVLTDAANVPFDGILNTNAWRFTTKPDGPADPVNLVVASDGSGDFCTVQGAVNFVPAGNADPIVCSIRDGDYVEIVNVSGKHNLLFRGQSRESTIIGYANNAVIAPGGTTQARMAFKVAADDVSLDNLTITNRTPQGGSQAEALMLQTSVQRFIANNVRVCSYQDTILANASSTQGYFQDSLIQGDVDFIWGGGNLFFTNCEIKCLRTGSVLTQPRTDQGSNGISFVNCQLTRAPGIGNSSCLLARPLGFQYSSVAYIRCLIDSHVSDWDTSLLIGRGGVKNPNLRWWEHGNSNLTATAAVVYSGHQIGETNNDPRLLAAENSEIWLYGWQPQLLPNLLSQPLDQTVGIGGTAMLTVTATGIPDPAYQWQRFGTNVPGAVTAALTLSNVQPADAGRYRVVVSNVAGQVVSDEALVAVVNQPPNPGITAVETVQDEPVSLAVDKLVLAATDPQGDAFDVTGVSPMSAQNGVVALGGGHVTYTPPAGYVGADAFTYTLTDLPGAATNVAVTVTVLPADLPGQNQVGQIQVVDGHPEVTFAGIPGRTYRIERSESMVDPVWVEVGTATADSQGQIVFTDLNPPAGEAYYRTAYP